MDNIYYISFNLFKFFIRVTPTFVLNFFVNCLTTLLFKIDKKHKKIAKANLDLAFKNGLTENEKLEIIKKCYKNLIFILVDFVKNQGISKDKLLEKIEFKNRNIIDNALKENQKIIIMTAHYGNWELLSLSIGAEFGSFNVVGRDLDSKKMQEILAKNRQQFNIKLLSKIGAMRGMMKALRNNEIAGLLVDQNTTEKEGELIEFFGKKARHTPSAALLAKKFDALIIPTFISTNDYNKYTIEFFEPIIYDQSLSPNDALLECISKQAEITENVIRRKPDEWFWFHQRWKNQYEEIYN